MPKKNTKIKIESTALHLDTQTIITVGPVLLVIFVWILLYVRTATLQLSEIHQIELWLMGGIGLMSMSLLWEVYYTNKQKRDLRALSNELQKSADLLQIKIDEQTVQLKKSYIKERKARKEKERTIKMLIQRDLDLRKINERLESLDQEKSAFISVAAHQLRTPLTAIKWIAQILGKSKDTPVQESGLYIERLKQTVDKMVLLIGDILNVTRIEEGRFGLNPVKGSIITAINDVIQSTDISRQAKDIKLETDIPKKLPSIKLDQEKIRLAIGNLVDNATKYTPNGGYVKITIKLQNKAIQILIADSGIGIPEKDVGKLFNKFYRASNALKIQTEGTGLGLFIAKNIIEGHGGIIACESKEGKGATFSVFLPISK